MSRLLESIRITNQKTFNLSYHQARLDASQNALFQDFKSIDLEQILRKKVPFLLPNQMYKCRVLYAEKLEKIELHPYVPKGIASLKIVHADDIDYAHKWEDRRAINRLFAQRKSCDDVLIIKNGLVTDTSYCNIVFSDGKDWFTPSTPLLAGTQRARLLAEGKIQAAVIRVQDITRFESFKLINSMLDFETAPEMVVPFIES